MTDPTPTPPPEEIAALVALAAASAGLPRTVVAAVVQVESGGDPRAYRFEPLFWSRYRLERHPLYGPLGPHRASASYGLMQLIFPAAHELGYRGAPEGLYDPALNLDLGCRKLRANLDWARDFNCGEARALQAALAAYNGGRGGNAPTQHPLRNASYAAKVAKVARALEAGAQHLRVADPV